MNWHNWTDDEKEIVRARYQGNKQSERDIAAQLSQLGNGTVTPSMVSHMVNRLGIRKVIYGPERAWTPEEDERVEELAQKMPVDRIAHFLGRTPTAVRVRMTRTGVSAVNRTGWYTKREVTQILGVDHKIVQRWIDAGALKANWYREGSKPQQGRSAEWQIQEEDLKDFIRKHAIELTGRNVDLFTIVNMLGAEANPISHFNLQGPQRAVDQYKLRKIGQHWDGKEWVWIWLVRGRQVRRHLQKNFTMGGHHYVYPQIPENEIWIDDHNYDERAPTIVHECDERIDMKFKKHSYHHGHNKANRTQRDFEIKNDDILREGYSPRRVPILIRGASR